jgi:hypothetical protein
VGKLLKLDFQGSFSNWTFREAFKIELPGKLLKLDFQGSF